MDEHDLLTAEQFEKHRARLRAVAYRMLGSLSEADDAVQDAWLRLSRTDADEIDNLGAWLTTVVARVSLNMLRSRATRREEPMDAHARADRRLGATAPTPSTRRSSPTPSGWRCSWCSRRSRRRSGWRSSSTTCSPCRSTRSRRSSTARPTPPASSPAGPGAGCAGARGPRRRPRPPAPRSSTPSSPRPATATSRPWSPCSIPTSSCAPTAGAGAPGRRRSEARTPSPARRRCSRASTSTSTPCLVNGAVGIVAFRDGRAVLGRRRHGRHGKIVEIDFLADPERLRQLDLTVLGD